MGHLFQLKNYIEVSYQLIRPAAPNKIPAVLPFTPHLTKHPYKRKFIHIR